MFKNKVFVRKVFCVFVTVILVLLVVSPFVGFVRATTTLGNASFDNSFGGGTSAGLLVGSNFVTSAGFSVQTGYAYVGNYSGDSPVCEIAIFVASSGVFVAHSASVSVGVFGWYSFQFYGAVSLSSSTSYFVAVYSDSACMWGCLSSGVMHVLNGGYAPWDDLGGAVGMDGSTCPAVYLTDTYSGVSSGGGSFGYPIVGGQSDDGRGLVLCNFTSPSDIQSLAKLSFYTQADSGSISMVGCVFADLDGYPVGNPVAVSGSVSVTTSLSWYNFTFNSALSPDTTYWFGVYSVSDYIWYVDNLDGHAVWYLYSVSSAVPNPAGGFFRTYSASTDAVLSEFMTYSSGSSPTSTPSAGGGAFMFGLSGAQQASVMTLIVMFALIFGPAVVGYKFVGVWGGFVGVNLGVGLGYVLFPSIVQLFLIVLIGVVDVALLFGKVGFGRGG